MSICSKIRILFVLLSFSGIAHAQISGASAGTAYATTPVLPQSLISSTINAANFPDLFTSPVMKTVKASGGSYTSCQAALTAVNSDAPNCGEIITVDAGYTCDTLGNQQFEYYAMVCPANKHVWLRSSAYATTLPAQGTKVSQANEAAMFEIVKYSTKGGYDSAFNICGSTSATNCTVGTGAQGLIITGLWLHNQGGVPIYADFYVGNASDTSALASRFWFDRVLVDTDSYNTEVAIGVYNNANWFSMTDTDLSGISVLHDTNFISAATVNAAGTGYHVNDQFNIVQSGGVAGQGVVTTVSGTTVTGIVVGNSGRSYTTATGIATTNIVGTGSGLTLNITANTSGQECGASPAGESHGFLSFNSNGPIKLVNDNIGGDPNATVQGSTTENFILGGAPPSVGTIQPADIELRESLLSKDPAQLNSGPGGSCTKNNFEVKGAGQRILADGNILQYSWNDPYESQTGVCCDFYVTQNGSTCPFCEVSNITFTNNVIKFAAGTFSVEGHNAVPPYIQYPVVHSILVDNDLWQGMSQATWGNPSSTTISGINVISGGVAGPPSNYNLPGPWNITLSNYGIYGASGNNMQYMYIQYPPGCDTSQKTVSPNWTIKNGVAIVDGVYGVGNGKLDSQCGYPNLQLVNTVFPNFQTDGKNILYNFKYTGSCAAGTACVCANWPSSPGVCPVGLASSPSQISAFTPMTNITACLAGTGPITNCNITGTYASRGPNIAQILAHQTLGNDVAIPGAGARTAP